MQATTTGRGIEEEIVQSVSADRLMADTEAIARWVRLSGSEEERRAFDYVAEVLRELSVEPTLHLAPTYISLPEGAELHVDGRNLTAITHSMAASTPPDGLHLSLVDVGSGSSADFAGKDVRGKAVLVAGMAMPGKALAAEEAGAAAVVFGNNDEHVHEMIVSDVWGSPTPGDRDTLPHIPVVTIGAADAGFLHEMLGGSEPVEIDLTTRVSTGWRQIPVLTAQVNGVSEPDKFVLFSGHIDSWHYGAMDNGTANATMLETLRVLLPHRDTFRRGLRLAFWSGHSHGRYAGSAWYADTFWEDLHENCVLHLNVDSVGGIGATVLTEAHAMAEARGVAAEAIRAVTGVEFTGTRFGRAGDQSFQGHGIPSLFMSLSEQPPIDNDAARGFAELIGGSARSGGLGWWWHTPEDTVDKIDPALLLRDAQIYALVTYRFLSERVLPLDLLASAQDLADRLKSWQSKAGDRFDLSSVVERANQAADLAAQLQAALPKADALPDETIARLNNAILTAERPLVQLNYVAGNPYTHDPGHSQPPVPLLAGIDELIQTEPDSDASYEWTTLLVRRRNQVLHGLREAELALRTAHSLIPS